MENRMREHDRLVRNMSFKEFAKFCNDRACDGDWDMMEAMSFSSICSDIYKIKVYRLKKLKLFVNRKATDQKREEEWQKIINS